jgi:YfiH family protein
MKLITPEWSAPSCIHAFVTTKEGGLSASPYQSLNLGDHVGDDPQKVLGNRLLIRAHLPSDPIWLTQTHSTIVSTPISRQQVSGAVSIHADAAVTNLPNEVLTIMTADCLPVLITSADGAVIGAAHAGWRGLCAGVIENTIMEMLRLSPHLQAGDLLAWMGPAIGPQSFEVGSDVVEAFQATNLPGQATAFMAIQDKPGKYLADIYQLALTRLKMLGVTSISGGDRCTVREWQEFFSYRRDGKTGRFGSFIWISN